MDQATHNKIVSFIWGIADDVLRDQFKRGAVKHLLDIEHQLLRRFKHGIHASDDTHRQDHLWVLLVKGVRP